MIIINTITKIKTKIINIQTQIIEITDIKKNMLNQEITIKVKKE